MVTKRSRKNTKEGNGVRRRRQFKIKRGEKYLEL